MRRIAVLALLLVAVLAFPVESSATEINLVVYPTMVNDGAPAVGTRDAVSGVGSWAANGTSYSKMLFTPQQLFGRTVTIGELASISYYTKTGATHVLDIHDWFFQIYTEPYPGQPVAGKWFGGRFGAEPYFSNELTETPGTWTQWQTGAGPNQLRFFDSTLNYYGSYTDGFLGDLTSRYSNQTIMSLGVGTGTGWANGFTGEIDSLRIVLTNGDVANVDFEPVPEPATLTLLGLGLAGVARAARRRRK